jgi:hypothetical protein
MDLSIGRRLPIELLGIPGALRRGPASRLQLVDARDDTFGVALLSSRPASGLAITSGVPTPPT